MPNAIMGMKICGICKLEKPVGDFSKNRSKKDGLQFRCKMCDAVRRDRDREYLKEHCRMYYYSHQEECRIKSKKYYQSHKEQQSLNAKRYRENPTRRAIEKENVLNKKYNFTLEEYQNLLQSQGGVCAICGLPERTRNKSNGNINQLTVDHDHITGKVRGLLCNRCNRCIGMTQDNSELLQKAVYYLEAGGFNATSNS